MEGFVWSASTCIAVNYMNLPAHIGVCETVIVDNIRPCGIGSDFQDSWVPCKKFSFINTWFSNSCFLLYTLIFPSHSSSLQQTYSKTLMLNLTICHAFNKIFSGRQPHQVLKVFHHFREWLCPHFQGVAGGLVEPKLINGCPTLCCVCLCSAWMWDRLWPLWLVGVVKGSLYLAWAAWCWLYRAFH
jgi:hypothetical protein